MKYLLSFDPGVSTGITLGKFSDDQPYTLVESWQVQGGVEGFIKWHGLNSDSIHYFDLEVVSEKFTPLTGQGFSHTQKSTEPLRVEGAILALGYDPVWQRPAMQYWVSGANAKEKRRKQKAWLKEYHPELYKTGKEFQHTDAEDYYSALFHALACTRKMEHEPTLRHYFGGK